MNEKRFVVPFHVNLATIFLMVILVLAGGLILQGYRSSSEIALEAARDLLLTTNERILERFRRTFDPVFSVVTIAAATNEVTDSPVLQTTHTALPFMIKALEINPQIYAVYMGYDGGDFFELARIVDLEEMKTRIGAPPEAHYGLLTILRMADGTGDKTWIYLDRTGKEIGRGETVKTGYDPTKRPWYRVAEGKESVAMTDMYVYSNLKKPGVSVSHYFDSFTMGVFTADITLTELAAFLAGQQVSESSRMFLFDRRGNLFAHPDENRTVKIVADRKTGKPRLVVAKVADLRDLVANEVFYRYQYGAWTDLSTFDVDGETYIAKITPIPARYGKDLAIVIIVPVSEFLGPIADIGIQSAVISGGLILLFLPIVIFISRRISASLHTIADEADAIRRFDLGGTAEVRSRISEIQQLGQSVATMKVALRSFGRYMPEALVETIVDSGIVPTPGGERRYITILFSDIQDFTTLSETLPPEDLLVQTSTYLDEMTAVITRRNGMIDKFIGDAVMAVWNGLRPNDRHAADACLALLDCRRRVSALNERFVAEGKPAFHTRFGLHTGDTVVGNVGSSERLDFTAIGSTVNMASRTEGLNKFYGTQLLVTETVRDSAGDAFLFRTIDKVIPKGATRPIRIFELLGTTDPDSPFALSPERMAMIEHWEKAYALYLDRQWESALSLFEQIHTADPDDRPALMYLERCYGFQATPPDPSWEGVEFRTEK